MSVIDLSGYSFTGKSAVYDLLSNVDGFQGLGVNFEFELLRAPGGIIELREALSSENWSPIRSSDAIRRFLKLVDNLGGDKSMPDRLARLGNHYDYYFPGFTENSMSYINKCLTGEWMAFWPFSKYQYNRTEVFLYKLFSNVGVDTENRVYLSRVDRKSFDAYTMEYLDRIFSSAITMNNKKLIINNAFEPFNPSVSSGLVRDAKAIIVDRDPRDIYLSAWKSSMGDGSKVGKAVIGNSVKDFVNRFMVYRGAVFSEPDNSSVFRMTFESLIKDFESVLAKLSDFLEIEKNSIDVEAICFDRDKSASNVGMWHDVSDAGLLKSISFIEDRLADYCIG